MLLSPVPSSVDQGVTEEMIIHSLESYPFSKIEPPIRSQDGLEIVDVLDPTDKSFRIIVTSSSNTKIGNHRFEIDAKGVLGRLDITVLKPESGPGTDWWCRR